MKKNSILMLILWMAAWFVPAQTVQAAPLPETAEIIPGELIIGVSPKMGASTLAMPDSTSILRSARSSGLLAKVNGMLVNVPKGQEEQYRLKFLRTRGVVYAEPNYRVKAADITPNDPLWNANTYSAQGQWGPKAIHAPAAWDLTMGSSSVIIAIVDSGVDAGQPDFAGRLLPGYDFVDNDTSTEDPYGHGTHTAGIATAAGNNGIGVAGISWGSQILPVRVLDAYGKGDILALAEGIIWATDHGAQIINLSLGTPGHSTLLEDAVFYAYSRKVALVAAVGNYAIPGVGGVIYPAAYDAYVLGVGAVDANLAHPSFSIMGPAVDLVAPGVGILSALADGKYGLLSGTSEATPHVSGALALLLAYAQTTFDTPDKLYEAVRQTADDLGAPGFDPIYGMGLLRVDRALVYKPHISPSPTDIPTLQVEYDLRTSSRCGNVPSAYESIGHNFQQYPTGNFVGIFGEDDSNTITLPWPFKFGGVDYTRATVSANGYLSFDVPAVGNIWENSIIPGGGAIRNRLQIFIAPFWDDLTSSAGVSAGIYAAALSNPQRLVVEWFKVARMKDPKSNGPYPGELTFEVILYPSGQIDFRYLTLNGVGASGDSATIGLEYNGGTAGVLYSFDRTGAVAAGQGIRITPANVGAVRSLGCLTAAPLPISGGTLTQAPFCLTVPGGLLQQPSTASIETFTSFTPLPENYTSLQYFAEINLTPVLLKPINPAPLVCYTYSAADVLKAGGNAENLFFAFYDPETRIWERLPTQVDVTLSQLRASIPEFGIFGIFSLAQPQELPATGTNWPWNAALLMAAGVLGAMLIWAVSRCRRG